MVYLRVGKRAVVPKGLQRAGTDVQHSAHVQIVHPLTHFLFAVPLADGFHTVDEAVELGDHRLKGLSFDRYDFHIHYFCCYCFFSGEGEYMLQVYLMATQVIQ